jgi:hypothetical protein
MRTLIFLATLVIIVGVAAALYFGGRTVTDAAKTKPAATSSEPGCDTVGSELNAMLDRASTSPNIARAKAEFERGIAECMWGRSAAANEHYRQAYKLLGEA